MTAINRIASNLKIIIIFITTILTTCLISQSSILRMDNLQQKENIGHEHLAEELTSIHTLLADSWEFNNQENDKLNNYAPIDGDGVESPEITVENQGGLIDIQSPDPNYNVNVVKISGKDREILERLVMGEAGNQGFEGAALVAQCIKDMYIHGNYDSIESVRISCKYSGSLKFEPNEDVITAVKYIFDEGGYAVKHRILYFYSPSNMEFGYSGFHESQNNVINYGGHKFFDEW